MPTAPDPFDLMIFARVAETGSFSAAAERLGLPKSTVSRRISVLESQLGERLLQRTTRRNFLTEMGQRILIPAEQIIHEVDAVMAVAEHRQVTPSGRLRVSVPGDLAAIALAPMLADFSRAYSEIQLELDLSPRYVDVIADGFDLAIRIGGETQDLQLTTRHLVNLGIGLYASPLYTDRTGEPDTPEALGRHDVLVLHADGIPVTWVLNRDALSVPVDMSARRVSANSYELLFRLARSGAGITAMPDLFARPYLASGELVRILPEWRLPPAMVRAVFPSRQLMPRKTRVFIDALLSHLKPRPLRSAQSLSA